MTERTETDAIVETAQQAAEVLHVAPGDLMVGSSPQHLLDLEKFAPAPREKSGYVSLHAPWALAQYVNAHKGGGTAIYADIETRTIAAVLNGHAPSWETASEEELAQRPGWGDHRAELELRHTPEWVFWSDADRSWMNQLDFALHVERGLADITDPPGADLLELAQSFEANTKVEFSSAVRVQSGQRRLTFKETTTASAGETGQMEVPETFTLALRPFEGTQPVEVKARLRYRISDGHLSICFELDRPEDTVRASFTELLDEIAAETEIKPYAGTAPAALR